MSEQASPELTTRDVLLQVDRRLTLIEEDLRALDAKVDANTNALRAEMYSSMAEFRRELRQEMNSGLTELRREMNTRFYWLVGLLFVSWLSTMGTILLKS